MNEDQVRRFFDTQLAGNIRSIQRDAQRITLDMCVAVAVTFGVPVIAAIAALVIALDGSASLQGPAMWIAAAICGLVAIAALVTGFRMLMPRALSATERVTDRFVTQFTRPVVEHLRPGWTYDTGSSLTEDELFASNLFQRIALTRFDVKSRVRGRAHDLPFEMHEVTATGLGERQYMRILLIGFLVHLKLPAPMEGHIRFCHQQPDKAWRRPAMDGYRSIDGGTVSGQYYVDATPDGPDLASIPGIVTLMLDLAKRGWLVHVAFGGLSAWVAIEQSRTWFDVRALPPYSADDVLQLDRAFSVIERVAGELSTPR